MTTNLSDALPRTLVSANPTARPLSLDDANRLAGAIQNGVPFERRPFDRIAETLDLAPNRVLGQISYWRESGLLREISAVLEGSALGYDSALVAGTVPVERIHAIGEFVNEMPTVTHNYIREHALNLWFTVAVPVEWGVERTLEAVRAHTGVEFHALRRTMTFKVGVNFDLASRRSRTRAVPLSAPEPVEHTARDRELFRVLQTDLPDTARPFEQLARRRGVDVDELLEFAQRHMGGAIRRYVATFRHRRLGVRGNGMVVWNVPEERLGEVGPLLAEHPDVSHCYARNPAPGFPFSLYSMIHGPDRQTCIDTARSLIPVVGTDDFLVLFSTVELKKCRLRYFLPELDAWWSKYAEPAR